MGIYSALYYNLKEKGFSYLIWFKEKLYDLQFAKLRNWKEKKFSVNISLFLLKCRGAKLSCEVQRLSESESQGLGSV